jgi:hypothetical protein
MKKSQILRLKTDVAAGKINIEESETSKANEHNNLKYEKLGSWKIM